MEGENRTKLFQNGLKVDDDSIWNVMMMMMENVAFENILKLSISADNFQASSYFIHLEEMEIDKSAVHI